MSNYAYLGVMSKSSLWLFSPNSLSSSCIYDHCLLCSVNYVEKCWQRDEGNIYECRRGEWFVDCALGLS